MSNLDCLKAETMARLPDNVDADLVQSLHGECIFLTSVFKDGFLLGFYAHSPWGNCRNQETGWVLLDRTFREIDRYETRSALPNVQYQTFNEWRTDIISRHGVGTKLCCEYDGTVFWKMGEAL